VSKKGLIAASVAAGALAAAPAALGASGSGNQVVTGTVASAISVTPSTPVLLAGGTLVPGSSSAATGSGTVAVVSTDRYCLTIADTTNGGKLTNTLGAPAGQFTSRLQWKSPDAGAAAGAGSFADLTGTAANVAINQTNTLLQTWNINYSQTLSGENVPSGVYQTTAAFTGQTC